MYTQIYEFRTNSRTCRPCHGANKLTDTKLIHSDRTAQICVGMKWASWSSLHTFPGLFCKRANNLQGSRAKEPHLPNQRAYISRQPRQMNLKQNFQTHSFRSFSFDMIIHKKPHVSTTCKVRFGLGLEVQIKCISSVAVETPHRKCLGYKCVI